MMSEEMVTKPLNPLGWKHGCCRCLSTGYLESDAGSILDLNPAGGTPVWGPAESYQTRCCSWFPVQGRQSAAFSSPLPPDQPCSAWENNTTHPTYSPAQQQRQQQTPPPGGGALTPAFPWCPSARS
ncbi:hypothetical protein INR49_017191 [Caranx melampygus]|nr:hypothetical protein INR49_017191 [Caranx melampygus]